MTRKTVIALPHTAGKWRTCTSNDLQVTQYLFLDYVSSCTHLVYGLS